MQDNITYERGTRIHQVTIVYVVQMYVNTPFTHAISEYFCTKPIICRKWACYLIQMIKNCATAIKVTGLGSIPLIWSSPCQVTFN